MKPAGFVTSKVTQLRIAGVNVHTARGTGISQSSVEIAKLMKKFKWQREQSSSTIIPAEALWGQVSINMDTYWFTEGTRLLQGK